MLQFLPPRVPAPKSISVAVHGEGLGKCNIAGVPPCNAHVTFFIPPNPYISRGYKNVIMYVAFLSPGGQRRQEGSDPCSNEDDTAVDEWTAAAAIQPQNTPRVRCPSVATGHLPGHR